MIGLRTVSKRYGEQEVLKDITLKFNKNELVILTGKSGSGKTTLLNILGLLDLSYDGDVFYEDINIKNSSLNMIDDIKKSNIGFIFQDGYLIDELTILDNILLGLDKKVMQERAIQLLDKFGLSENIYDFPNEISGGQAQRVSIVRTIINNKKVLLADEPTSGLDEKNANYVMQMLKDYSNNALVIVTTHLKSHLVLADRHLEIVDGYIYENISSKDKEELRLNEIAKTKTNKKFFIKEAINNINQFKFKTILSSILFILTLTLTIFSINVLFDSESSIILDSMYRDGINSYYVGKESTYEYRTEQDNDIHLKSVYYFTEDDLKEINKQTQNYYSAYMLNENFGQHILLNDVLESGHQDECDMYYRALSGYLEVDSNYLTKNNYSLTYGNMPSSYDQCLISLYMFYAFKQCGYKDGLPLVEINTYDDIIGRTIKGLNICGIVDTNVGTEKTMEEVSLLSRNAYTLFVNKGFHSNKDVKMTFVNREDFISIGKDGVSESIYYSSVNELKDNEAIVLWSDIISSFNVSNRIKNYAKENFSEYPESDIYDDYMDYIKNNEINEYNPERSMKYFILQEYNENFDGIDRTITKTFFTSQGEKTIELKVVGIGSSLSIVLSESLYDEIYSEMLVNRESSLEIILTGNRSKDLKVLKYFCSSDIFYVKNDYASKYKELESFMIFAGAICGGLAFIMLVIAIIYLTKYMVEIFNLQIKKNSILKALGFKNNEISLIYLFQVGIVFLISFIVSIGAGFFARKIYQINMAKKISFKLAFEPISFFGIIVVFVFVSLVTSIFIVRKIKSVYKKNSSLEAILKRG